MLPTQLADHLWDIDHDPWGTALNAAFDIAELLWCVAPDDIPDSWQFESAHPSESENALASLMFDSPLVDDLFRAYADHTITVPELVTLGQWCVDYYRAHEHLSY